MNLPCQPFGHSQPAGHDNPKATDHVCSAAELTVLCSNKECGELRKNSHLPLKFPQHSAKATILYKCLLDTSLQVYIHTHLTARFRTTQVSRYQKGKTNLDFTEARDSEWQWHQLGHMQVCTSLQTNNHASTPPLRFLQAGCPSCCPTNTTLTDLVCSGCPTNSIKALKVEPHLSYKLSKSAEP